MPATGLSLTRVFIRSLAPGSDCHESQLLRIGFEGLATGSSAPWKGAGQQRVEVPGSGRQGCRSRKVKVLLPSIA
jgi:hypothetical protein